MTRDEGNITGGGKPNAAFEGSITPEYLRSIFNYDPETGIVTHERSVGAHHPGDIVGCLRPDGYLVTAIHQRLTLLHRVAWCLHYGAWPIGYIDHINGTKSDNRICNMRSATKSQNNANGGLRANNTSGLKGVHWDKRRNKWIAQIKNKASKKIYLGSFATKEAAHQAYRDAAASAHGEFARFG